MSIEETPSSPAPAPSADSTPPVEPGTGTLAQPVQAEPVNQGSGQEAPAVDTGSAETAQATAAASGAATEVASQGASEAVSEAASEAAPGPAQGTLATLTAAPDGAGTAPAPEAAPLPEEALAIDAQIDAALKMVRHGAARLSKLAGNIRFSFLQRDESRLVTERRNLKLAFQKQESSEAELKFGLQALLQKTERMAGSLLHVPAPKTEASSSASAAPTTETATDTDASAASTSATADSPAAAPTKAVLEPARSNQIRQTLRKSMMALAPAAPLHLQIELAPAFADADPDIMAMAARVHALHRLVLGSLKRIQWHTPVACTLGFEDGRTVELQFGEQGVLDIPAEFRQPAPATQPSDKGQAGKTTAKGGHRAGQGRGAGRSGHDRRQGGNEHRNTPRPSDETDASQAASKDGANGGQARGQRQGGRTSGSAGHGKPGNDGRPRRERGQHPARTGGNQATNQNAQASNQSTSSGAEQAGQGGLQGRGSHASHRSQGAGGERTRTGKPHPGGRHGQDQGRRGRADERPARGQKAFPGNSAMADKLREALGSLKLGNGKKD